MKQITLGRATLRGEKQVNYIFNYDRIHLHIEAFIMSLRVKYCQISGDCYKWHTRVSRRSVNLTGALRLHRPIAAQEKLPTQRCEEPAQAVRDRFGGTTFCTA